MRYYVGVDWADAAHAIWTVDEAGGVVTKRTVAHSAEGRSEWGRELDQWRAQGIELWAAIERPEGRVVDFLLDHGVVVYPLNPKARDRARGTASARAGPRAMRSMRGWRRSFCARTKGILRPCSPARRPRRN